MKFSVIICTHNPRKEYLRRTLESIRSQEFDKASYELIVVDNASSQEVESEFDISWQPSGRIIHENNLGLINARLRGIDEAKGDWILFLDDDNVMELDYLSKAAYHGQNCPFLGAFGGSLKGEFEIEPPDYLRKYLGFLAIRETKRDVYSNLYQFNTTPAGAGMVIRMEIARQYANNVRSNKIGKILGRKGTNLMSGEDVDMAYTAIDMGYGCGLFSDMKITHLIPKSRLSERYLINIMKSIKTSRLLLDYFRFGKDPRQNVISIRDFAEEVIKWISFRKVSFKSVSFEFRRYRGLLSARKAAYRIIGKI